MVKFIDLRFFKILCDLSEIIVDGKRLRKLIFNFKIVFIYNIC